MKFRDPETGEFKELYTKAADTLPVGTVVDFDGTEIPAGWEEIEDEYYYRDGDTFNPSTEIIMNGFISGGALAVELYPIILNKSLKNIDSITINSCSATLRGGDGYLDSTSGYRNLLDSAIFNNVSVDKVSDNSLKLYISKPEVFTNITNNTVVSAKVRISLTFNE